MPIKPTIAPVEIGLQRWVIKFLNVALTEIAALGALLIGSELVPFFIANTANRSSAPRVSSSAPEYPT